MSTVQKIDQENKYEIMQNKEGEILILINARAGGPEKPRFLYDGKETALLYRSQERAIIFKSIVKDARLPLKSVSNLLIVEVEDDYIIREYEVPVRIVKDVKALIK